MTLVFRSGCREEFWEKYLLRNSCPLIYKSETFVKSVKKYLWSPTACNLTKMWTFLVIFQWIWSVVKTAIFVITPLSNCVLLCLLIFTLLRYWFFFFSSFKFLFFFYWKDWTFWKKSILVYGLPVCTCSLQIWGVSPLLIKNVFFLAGEWGEGGLAHSEILISVHATLKKMNP